MKLAELIQPQHVLLDLQETKRPVPLGADCPPVALSAEPAAGVGVVAVSVVANRVSAEVEATLSVDETMAELEAGAVSTVGVRLVESYR